jgi:hypothetical protein
MALAKDNAVTATPPKPENRPARAKQSTWMMAGLAALAFAVCCLRSFVPPHTPLLLWGDQLGFATKGVRVLGGELPYRDFFEFVTPGTELVYALLFRLLGVSLYVPNLLMALVAATAALWMTWCAKRLLRGIFVVLPATLLIGFVLYGSMDATHHWFSTLAVMGAVAALFEGTSLRRVAVAGAMCGLAASFTQTKGAAVLLGLVAYLIWRSLHQKTAAAQCSRQCLLLCAAALVVFAAINGPLLLAAGAEQWMQDVIVFPSRYFGSVSSNQWGGFWEEFSLHRGVLKWICFPFLYLTVPLAYAGFFTTLSRRSNLEHDEPWDQLMLIAVVGVAMFLVMAPALSIRRISCVSPPAMILLAWLLSRAGIIWAKAAGTLAAVSLGVALAQIAAIQSRRPNELELPVGRVVVPEAANYEVYRWMAEHTRPGQWYFGLPPLTLPLGLRNPTSIETPAPGEFSRPEQIAAAVNDLERTRTPLLVLRPAMYIPHLLGNRADHLQPFQDYVYLHYRRTKVFSNGDEVWQRIDATDLTDRTVPTGR